MPDKFNKEKYIYTPIGKNIDAIPLWFCFPSTYPIGMSSLGYLSLFRILDQNKNVHPERIFTDTGKTKFSIDAVKLMGFSFSFEIDFLGVFKTFDKYKIPFRAKDRGLEYPIIFGGGPVLTANPEPYTEFFDVILVGDGEETITRFVESYKEVQHLEDKERILSHLSKIPGIYVPSLYEIEYKQDNTIKSRNKNLPIASDIIERQCIGDLSKCIYSPILTDKAVFKDTFIIEVARGCPRRCRFCLASYLNLPARYPDYKNINEAIDFGLNYSNKIGLLGALIAEHPDFEKICEHILEKRNKKEFEISVSSLRADKITPLVVETLVKCGQKSSTIAIEAGSDRLRKFINKNLTEEQIFESVKTARENGLSGLKIYGIIGLPTEIDQDIEELRSLMFRLKEENKKFKLTLSVSSFVPKSHTPFQWESREDNKIIHDKQEYLRKELHKAGMEFKPTSVKWDYIQAILSRGDRRLAPLLEFVYKYGGTIGSWTRSYKELISEGYDIPELDWYALRERPYDEILPWDFIHSGLDREILQKERENSYKLPARY